MKLHDLFCNGKAKTRALPVISGIISHGKGLKKIFPNLLRDPDAVVSDFNTDAPLRLLKGDIYRGSFGVMLEGVGKNIVKYP